MTTNHRTTYHHKGIWVDGGINLNDGIIDNIKKINIGDWSFEIDLEGNLCISNDEQVRAKINTNRSFTDNILYQRYFMVMQPNIVDDCIGMFVSGTGKYYNMDLSQTPSEKNSLPTIILSDIKQDPRILGNIIECEKYNRVYTQGNFESVYEQDDSINRVIVSNHGIQSVWVCDINGPLNNGDLITTSSIIGYGMKQPDNLVRNYSGPKITQNCDFFPNTIILQKPVDIDAEGVIYETLTNSRGEPITDVEYRIKYINKNGVQCKHIDFVNDIQSFLETDKKLTKKNVNKILLHQKRNIFRACLVGCCYI